MLTTQFAHKYDTCNCYVRLPNYHILSDTFITMYAYSKYIAHVTFAIYKKRQVSLG